MASIEDSCDSYNKSIKTQLDLFVVQLVSMQSACESIISSIKRLEEFKQERQNAPFITLQVNTSNLQAEFRNIFKEYHKTSINALRTEILEEIRSLLKDLIKDKSSDSVQDGATYTLSPEPEDLEDEPQRKRCRSRNKAKQPNRNDKRARIADVGVELRCESAAHDRMVIRTPESTLLTGAVHARPGELSALFADAFDIPVESAAHDRMVIRTPESTLLTRAVHARPGELSALFADASDIPVEPKKRRAQLPSTLTRSADISRILSPKKVTQQSKTKHLTPMLQEASESDFQPSPASAGIEPAILTQHEKGAHGSEASETTSGSLDRTKVITDSKRFIDYHWGVQGTMLKIFHCVVKGVPQITVESLVQRGPVIESLRRFIAVRCFVSILKLRSNGFIKVIKDLETNSIKHIELGPRITKGR